MSTSNLSDLWRAYDRALAGAAAPDMRQLRAVYLNQSRSALGRLSRGVLTETLFNVPVLIVLMGFIAAHARSPEFLLPALALLAMVVAQMAFGIHQLGQVHELDYAVPVVTLLKRLAVLRVRRIRVTQWTFLLAPLLWVPLLLVAIKGLLGVNPYAILTAEWLFVNALFGVAVIPLGWWISRRLAGRFGQSRILRSLLDDIAGRSLLEAMAHLRELSQAENAAPPA